jgi:hypothetical protein
MRNRFKVAGLILASAGLLTMANATPVTSPVTLTDGNSTALVDFTHQSGMNNWTVDGVNNLYQQWFWYRVGSAGKENSIDTLTLLSATQPDPSSLDVKYQGNGFTVEVNYDLAGGLAGSKKADIGEAITINNTGNNTLNFHFFQYSDFDLQGTSGNDQVNLIGAPGSWYVARQTKVGGMRLSETITTPPANNAEAGLYPNTLNKLNDGVATTLNNNATASGDATWAFEWDARIARDGSYIISKDKSLRLMCVPDGGMAVALLGFALIGVEGLRRKVSK